MNLPEMGVKKAVTTAMIFIGIIIMGGVSLSRLGLDMLPDIEIPTIMVITTYQGAGPEEVETRITRIAEDRLSTVEDIDSIEATSREGISLLTLMFHWGADLDNAVNNIRDQLDIIKPALPDDADDPIIFKFDIAMIPALVYGVSADEATYPHLKKMLEDEIAIPLESVPGVASVTVSGGLERAILVELDSQRLRAYNLSTTQIINALRMENLSSPGGNIRTGSMDYIVRVPAELKTQEIESVVVAYNNGTPIRIQDVATVKDDFKEVTQESLINRRPGLILMVQKESGANTVNVCKSVFAKMKTLKNNLPSNVEFTLVLDSSDQIIKSINNLRNSLLTGGILVILVILLFLGSLRSSLIIATSIPVSLIATFIFLYMAGYTINILSLSALAIAIGMVVDASIVVYENIYRHIENGQEIQKASIVGGSEVAGAMTASVMCIVAIFIPVIFAGGLAAVFFKQLAYVCSIAIIASLLTALTLIPMLNSKNLASKKEKSMTDKKDLSTKLMLFTNKWFTKLENTYENALKKALRHRKRVIFTSLAVFLVSLFMIRFVGSDFIPQQDEGRLSFSITLPVGTRFEKTGEVTKAVEDIVYREIPELKMTRTSWGVGASGGIATLMGGEQASHIGNITVALVDKSERRRTPQQIAHDMSDKLNIFPDAEVKYSAASMSGAMLGGGHPLSVEVRGHDLNHAKDISLRVANTLENIDGVTDVTISRKEGRPELQVLIDRERASLLGVNAATISSILTTYFQGSVATFYREAGDEFDILVQLKPEDRSTIEDLKNILVPLPNGGQVPLSQVATVVKETGPIAIERAGRERTVKVEGDIYGRDLGSIVHEAREKLSTIKMPPGFSLYFSGDYQEQQKAFKSLGFALILGIILVFMIMASQFESLIDPFVIMFAIPFSFIGVVWALLLTRNTLSLISFLGLIMIVGMGVQTGIVFVSFIKQLREEGTELLTAVVKAGKLRLRPVIMTTLTTVFGILPMALSRGEGSEIWVALGVSIIGGLLVSFIVTLFLIPILYTIFEERILSKIQNK